MAWLVDARGRRLELRTDGTTRIGWASDNDLVLKDSTVSRHHAEICFDSGRAFLRDVGSSNGTFIGGAKVSGGELTDGSVVKLGRVELVYRESVGAHSVLPPVSPPRDLARTPPQNSFFSARTGAILGALFLLGLIATLAGHALLTSSSSSIGSSNFGTLVEGQTYRLPNASSDFIGDWCGWKRVVSCDPPDSCDEEPVPESMGFKSDAGGVLMEYSLVATPDTEIRDIDVSALDSRHVRVTWLRRSTDSTGAEVLTKRRADIDSVSSAAVRVTEYSAFSVTGIAKGSEEDSTELIKCSDEFGASQKKYDEQHKLVEKGEVSGRVPSK
jgi:hypothetical protein